MIQTLFLNNDAVFHDTAGTVQLWFEENGVEFQHLPWSAQSPDLNIAQLVRSVLETRVRNRFLPTESLKQLEDVLQEDCIKYWLY
jgi:hypothetical protein